MCAPENRTAMEGAHTGAPLRGLFACYRDFRCVPGGETPPLRGLFVSNRHGGDIPLKFQEVFL